MSKSDYPPEFESQVRKAMDVPEPNANTMDALREQFIARGMTTLKTDLQVDPASNPFRPEKDSTMKQKTSRLSPPLAAKFENKSFITTLRARPVVAILLALLILLSLTGVVYAIGRSLGYIPGVGVVDLSVEPRKLAEPVSQTRDGITITVESAILSADLTVIEVKVVGIPTSAYPPESTPPGQRQECSSMVSMRLPDGAILEMVIRSNYAAIGSAFGASENETTWTLEPVPANIDTATLVMPCILGLKPGAAPENWEVPLRFVSVNANESVPGIPVATQAILTPMLATPAAGTPTQNVTPSEIKKLTECDTSCSWPVWSPDGRYIAYYNGDLQALWVMDANGENPRLLSSITRQFAWSPDGTQIAVISAARLFVIHADGTGLLALNDAVSDWAAPVWSPDGKRIAFLANDGNQQILSSIDVDGNNLHSLYNQPNDTLDQFFWLPDNRQIVFTTQTCRGMKCINGLNLIDIDGKGLQSLYAAENMILWFLSQDGKQAYVLDQSGGVSYRVNLDGSGTAQLAAIPPGQWLPIAPDGTQATYISSDGYLEIMNIDGTDRRTLVKQAIVGTNSWSPDGKHIAFISTSQGEDELYVINTDGSGLVNVTNHPGYSDFLPVWSPDVLHLAFVSSPLSPDQTSPAKSQIYIVDLPN
jgi:Tol biopolymer transport system component